MQTGAIFARGSCRALKWMALFGVVFALVAGQAAAQVTFSGKDGVKGDEGGRVTVTMTAKIRVAITQGTAQTVTVAAPEANITGVEVDNDKLLSPADGTDGANDYTLPAETTLVIPGNPSTVTPFDTTVTHAFEIQLQSDTDAEDEVFNVVFPDLGTTIGGLTGITQEESSSAITAVTAANRTRKITINDTDDQEFMWKVDTAKPTEGTDIMVSLTAKPTPVDLSYVTALRVDTTGYSVKPSSWTFDAAAGDPADGTGPMTMITVTPPKTDKNRDMDRIMVEATVAGTASSRVPALPIDVADIHALPVAEKISVKAYTDDGEGKASKTETMSVMEGGDPVHVTVTVDRGTNGYPSGEDLKVSVMADASQALDYRVDSTMVTVAKGTGEKSATFKLWALKNDDVGEEDLMLTLTAKGATADNGSGEVMKMFSIAIEDDTTAKVWAKDGAMDAVYGAKNAAAGDDEKINPGENFELMTDDLFGHLPTVTVDYSASSDNSAVAVSAAGDKIMVMPQDMEGTAKITITANAEDKASSFKTSQTRSDRARIMFEVDVTLAALTYTIMGPENHNLVEGMDHANGTKTSAMVTVMASRPLAGDETAKVMLMRDGSSSASMDDFTVMPEMVTLGAGDEMAEFTVTAVADDMPDGGAGMPEMLTLFAVVNDMQMTDQSVMFYLWDQAVPALPIIAQLLLAAFLAIGGYRRYLRR